MVYALVQWSVVRERVFLGFAVSSAAATVFFLAYFGSGPQLLWGESVWMNRNVWAPSILTMIGAKARFVHDALGLARVEPRMAMALRAVAIAAGLAAVAMLAGRLDLQDASVAANQLGPWPPVRQPRRAAHHHRLERSAGRNLGADGLQRGWLALTFWTDHALQLAMTVEIVLWMFVLAMRVQDVRESDAAARRENALLHTLAFSDPLTGLQNRRGLYLALEQSLRAALPARAVAVYLIDFDQFKPVNDQFGHDAVDELLVEVGRRLKAQLGALDLVARLGGDEFVVVVHKIPDDTTAQAIGGRLLSAMDRPFAVAGALARVGATVGYAVAPGDARDMSNLLRCADAAMYQGKSEGRNRVLRGGAMPQPAEPRARRRA